MSAANPTVQRYPRTLDQAFPGSIDYGCAITRTGPGAASIGLWVGRCIGAAIMLLLVGAVWHWTQTPETESLALADARTQQQTQTRFERAARKMCGGNVAWLDTQRAMVQCGKKKVAP